MPQVHLNGADIHYTDSGGDRPAIIFSHGLLMSGAMFDDQVAYFSDRYRCITFDHRGQGHSGVTKDGYDMETLAADAAALITHLKVAPCHFVGLSMGGFIGMRLAAKYPALISTLTLLGTSALPEPKENIAKYRLLNLVGRWIGLWAVIGKVMPIMFGKTFLNDPKRTTLKQRWANAIVGNHRIGISRAVKGVIEREGCAELLDAIQIPVGIGVGDEDVATKPPKSQAIHAAVAGSELVLLKGAGHSASVEAPTEVNALIERTIARSG
ncbi:alpha/beta fold hydrolase [Yoonia sediminilitoris]|nr:alpha/beta hydrolase [Yoonia sediminilitoris]